MKKPAPTTTSLLAWSLISLGILGLIASTVILLHHARPNNKAGGVDVTKAPSSTKPSTKEVGAYAVAPTLPKYVTIPTANVPQSKVIALGLTTTGAIATPDNIYNAGWYNNSSRPGQPGAMFIYAHVSSLTAKGLFYNLKELTPGDQVMVTRGDNTVYRYRVVSSKIYPADAVDMKQVLSPVQPGQPGLNLMTCTGQLNNAGQFNQRLVVFTSLASN